MRRFIICLIAVPVLVIALTWIWVVKRPMTFLDHEYPMWKAKEDMASNLPANSVVILGDSRPVADMIPAQIGPDVINLAVGGGTTFETYAFARKVLSSPNLPRAVVISLTPPHFMITDMFWDRGVKFGLIDRTTLEQIRSRSRQFDDRIVWAGISLTFDDLGPLFGPPSVGDVEARLKIALYSSRFPSFYYSSLVAGGLFLRENNKEHIYRGIRQSLGYHSFGTLNGSRALAPETGFPAFHPAPSMESYFSDTIALFQAKNIPVYFIACPLNEVSAASLHPGYADDFVAYMKTYDTRYSNFHRLGDPFPIMPWTAFGDPNHLNLQGALLFSDRVAALLREAGVENKITTAR
jgi:hypothetical protein